MKIVDKSGESMNGFVGSGRLNDIEPLVQKHFPSCKISKLLNFLCIENPNEDSPPKHLVAIFSVHESYFPGLMRLYHSSFEGMATEFGKEYEERGFNKPFGTHPFFEEGPFILEKSYID
jgi:hypothetical protein